jgi:hypothetical protein
MPTPQEIDVIKDVLHVVLVLGGIFVACRFYLHLAPRIDLQLSPRWMGGYQGICVLTIKLTNNSKVRIRKKDVRLQILFYPMSRMPNLSEWVPFSKDAVLCGQEPGEWREP